MKTWIARFVKEDEGQDLIEYALLCTFIAVVVSAGASALGTKLNSWYTAMSSNVSGMSTSLGS